MSETDFVVIDAGGGTVDITVHHNQSEGGLVELHSPSGGIWGSSEINKQFEGLLEGVLGKENMVVNNSTDWFEVMDIFEVHMPNWF